MTDIKVPIGRGLTQQIEKFPNIPKSIPEFPKFQSKLATSDLEFFKKISDEGRLRINEGSFNTASSTGTSAEIIPTNGETFYLLSASFNQKQQISGNTNLQNDGVNRQRNAFAGANINFLGQFSIATDSLIGNGVKSYRMRVTNGAGTNACSGTLVGYIEQSETLSSRGGM